jgi:hypothetical protein
VRRFSEAIVEGNSEDNEHEDGRTTGSTAGTRAARRLSETAVWQDMPVTFSKPDPNTRRFVWIHLPFTNPSWVKVSLGLAG